MTAVGADVIAAAARQLERAQQTRTPCRPVRARLASDDLEASVARAYQVQMELVSRRTAAGARVVGRKIGLTNPKVQAQLGVDRPDFGLLTDDMRAAQDQPVDCARLLQPRIEAEIAFVLNADLDRENVTDADVVAATDYVVAALEIVDSRIADWNISILDTIADNGSSAMFVLGDEHVRIDGLDLAQVAMTMTKDGKPVSTGLGSDCLGNPVTAVAWLANAARRYGNPLRAGEVVLSGALGPMVAVEPGASFSADIAGIGSVRASFAAVAATG